MTKDELILKGKHKVRGNSDLMLHYIELFRQQFGYKPNCAGCTFNSDWNKFVAKKGGAISSNAVGASAKSFELVKKQNIILSFKHDGKTYRSYDNTMSENFAIGYLTHGTETELQIRKKLFRKLPDGIST